MTKIHAMYGSEDFLLEYILLSVIRTCPWVMRGWNKAASLLRLGGFLRSGYIHKLTLAVTFTFPYKESFCAKRYSALGDMLVLLYFSFKTIAVYYLQRRGKKLEEDNIITILWRLLCLIVSRPDSCSASNDTHIQNSTDVQFLRANDSIVLLAAAETTTRFPFRQIFFF